MAAGGPALRATCLEPELFGAAAMEAVDKDLMEMKVAELREELGARRATSCSRGTRRGCAAGCTPRLCAPTSRGRRPRGFRAGE